MHRCGGNADLTLQGALGIGERDGQFKIAGSTKQANAGVSETVENERLVIHTQ